MPERPRNVHVRSTCARGAQATSPAAQPASSYGASLAALTAPWRGIITRLPGPAEYSRVCFAPAHFVLPCAPLPALLCPDALPALEDAGSQCAMLNLPGHNSRLDGCQPQRIVHAFLPPRQTHSRTRQGKKNGIGSCLSWSVGKCPNCADHGRDCRASEDEQVKANVDVAHFAAE